MAVAASNGLLKWNIRCASFLVEVKADTLQPQFMPHSGRLAPMRVIMWRMRVNQPCMRP